MENTSPSEELVRIQLMLRTNRYNTSKTSLLVVVMHDSLKTNQTKPLLGVSYHLFNLKWQW